MLTFIIAIFGLFQGLAHRVTHGESEDSAPTFTRLRFKFPAESRQGSSFAEADASVVTTVGLSAEEKDALWEQEQNIFLRQRAVQSVWHRLVKVYNGSDMPEVVERVEVIKAGFVPGLNKVTFGEVFDALGRAQCPIWMIGGTVRDLLAGGTPNDVDCAVLCNSNKVREVARAMGWKNNGGNAQYFSIGDAHGDDPNYLEGFSIDLVFNDPFTPEWSVNMLMWSLAYNNVIDPSGHGAEDARNQMLRPGAPPDELVRERTQWGAWRQWILKSFSSPTMQRHVRYLKMRARGWQPLNECVRFFMANQILIAASIENQIPTGPTTTFLGESQPSAPGATLAFLAEKTLEMTNEGEKLEFVRTFFDIMKEDLEKYFATTRKDYGSCLNNKRAGALSYGKVSKERLAAKSYKDVIKIGLVSMCTTPSELLRQVANPRPGQPAPPKMDFVGACRAVISAYQEISGESGLRASNFALPARPPFQGGHYRPPILMPGYGGRGRPLIPADQMPILVHPALPPPGGRNMLPPALPMGPGMRPGRFPGGRPVMHPGMNPGMIPGGRGVMHPGMNPGMNPGGRPVMHPGMNPGMNPGGRPVMHPGMHHGRPF